MDCDFKLLGPEDAPLLAGASEDVFDHAPKESLISEFLHDPRHHLVGAIVDGTLVGFVSAVHYVHPDKEAELWINEVGVAPQHQGKGIGKQMMQLMLEHGRALGCKTAWVLTDRDNAAAMRLYAGAGGVEAKMDCVMFEFTMD